MNNIVLTVQFKEKKKFENVLKNNNSVQYKYHSITDLHLPLSKKKYVSLLFSFGP